MKQVQGSVLSSKWESLVNNLGHTCRKLGKFQESLEYHQQALVLQPMTHSTYAAIGYAHALLGDLIEAVEAFHRALSLKRDDTFSKSMLNYVIEQLMGDTAPFEGKNQTLFYSRPLKNHGHKCFITERKQREMGHNIEPLYCQQTKCY